MAKKETTKQKTRRPELHTKEELINYLENNPETELPFLEELWERSVELAERDKKEGKKTVGIVTTKGDGTKTTKYKPSGFWSENPVSWYFKQSGLVQWRTKAVKIAEEKEKKELGTEYQQKIASASFDDEDGESYSDELTSWINLFAPNDRAFLKKRYVHYYDCYEINEGADKATLKGILSLEIALHRIDLKRALGQNISINEEEKLRKQFREAFESLKWTKKQRNARDEMAQNKFTVWIQDVSKEDEFKPKKREYKKDDIDYLLEVFIDSAREMMS